MVVTEPEWFCASDRAWIFVTHDRGGNGVGRDRIESGDEHTRLGKLQLRGLLAPGSFPATHRGNAIDNREVNRAGGANIDDYSRHAPGRIGRSDALFQARQSNSFESLGIVQRSATGRGFLIAGLIAVERVWRQ